MKTKREQEFDVNVLTKVSATRVADLLVGAIEGGSTYWLSEIIPGPEVSGFGSKNARARDYYPRAIRYPLSGGYTTFRVAEESDPEKTYRLDEAAIKRGLNTLATRYHRHFADIVNENDDAETSDTFLQCCLFGELVYG